MSGAHRKRRPSSHDYRIGELVRIDVHVAGVDAGDVVQIVGFRGETRLRLLPIGGVPVVAGCEQVLRVGLPSGSSKPPVRRFYHRRRPRVKPAAAAAAT